MKEGMAQKFRDIKTTLQDNKAIDETVKNPMYKGPSD